MIPYDSRKPMDPSGVRLGTPALTTRGMKEPEMTQIAKWIVEALRHPEDTRRCEQVRQQVLEMAQQFPVPADSLAEPATA